MNRRPQPLYSEARRQHTNTSPEHAEARTALDRYRAGRSLRDQAGGDPVALYELARLVRKFAADYGMTRELRAALDCGHGYTLVDSCPMCDGAEM